MGPGRPVPHRVASRLVVVGLVGVLTLFQPPATTPAQAAARACPSGWVALTFDDGPGPSTRALLDVLATDEVPGTFFVLGAQVERRPEIVLRTARGGHEVANHGYSHTSFLRLSSDAVRGEIRRTDRAIRSTGVPPLLLLRPPYGAWEGAGGRVDRIATSEGYRVVTWNVDPTDYRATTAEIRTRVRANLRPGAIILLHDGTNSAPRMIAAIADIIRDAHDRGYCFGVLDHRGRVIPRHLGVFIDIHGTTHQAAIEELATAGLVSGCNPPVGTRFCPYDRVTRGQFASILVAAMTARGIELPVASGATPAFTDVAADGAHAGAIQALAVAGVARGCNPPDNDRFCPHRRLTRAQLATFLVAALSLDPEAADEPAPAEETEAQEAVEAPQEQGTEEPVWRFADVPPDSTHAGSIELLAESGITQGCGGASPGSFCPEASLSRGQLASFVVRAVVGPEPG
jgi:peptidoglycan-N-acetylglucosamine deacetylase